MAEDQRCRHLRTIEGRWNPNPLYDPSEDEGYKGDPYEWVPEHTVSTTVDVDVHSMRCTQCGEIVPY